MEELCPASSSKAPSKMSIPSGPLVTLFTTTKLSVKSPPRNWSRLANAKRGTDTFDEEVR